MQRDSRQILFRAAYGALSAIPFLVSACAVSDAALGSDQAAADAGNDTEECREGAMRSCRCEQGEGFAVCSGGAYGECDCSGADPDDESSADASETPRKPACKAGYYEGQFSGRYRPGVFGFGVLGSGLPFDIAGGPMGARPGLSFTLEENAIGPAGEFSSFTVGNGCMTGIAKAVGTDNPFVARLTGDLDCATGEFVGVLDGYYTLLNVPGANFKFSGPITAQFEVEQASLGDGNWSVMEPPALNGDPAGGGDGTWSAIYRAPQPPQRGEDPCREIASQNVDGGVTDASVASASRDAR